MNQHSQPLPQDSGAERRATRLFDYKRPMLLAFALVMLPCLALFWRGRERSHEQLQEHFQSDASLMSTIVANALLIHLVDVSSLGRFITAADPLTRHNFQSFIRPIITEHGGATAYEWIPLVPDGLRHAFEAQASSETGRPVRITQLLPDGSLGTAETRPVYYPVHLVEPEDGNAPAAGYDQGASPARLAALETARDLGFPVVSDRVRLVQDVGAQFGFLVYYPVYAAKAPVDTVQQRRAALRGFALGVFRFADVLQHALGAMQGKGFTLELCDLAAKPGEEALYSNSAPASQARRQEATLQGARGLLFVKDLPFAGRTWQIRMAPKDSYIQANTTYSHWLILPFGGALSILAALFTATLLRNRDRLENRSNLLALANIHLEHEAAKRKLALRDVDQVLGAVSAVLIGVDNAEKVSKWNASAEQIFAVSARAAQGKPLGSLPLAWDKDRVAMAMASCRAERKPVKVNNLGVMRAGGGETFLLLTVNPIINESGGIEGYLLLGDDITEIKHLETQLIHSQKLESIGQLAAGIAHEINTPIQYVSDSSLFLKEAFQDMAQVLNLLEDQPDPDDEHRLLDGMRAAMQAIDYPFLRSEAPRSFDRVLDGVERISTIVLAMKRFSHPGGAEKQPFDLNKALENTLVVSRNEWKYVADVQTLFEPNLPEALCTPGDINQVLLNIVVNAAHAIGDVVAGTADKGRITITTRSGPDFVEAAISDTGPGIPEANRTKIFDPFFTTKEVGKGTGQGLAIAYDLVVKKHGGTLTFETAEGRGATFFIRLPRPPAPSDQPPRAGKP